MTQSASGTDALDARYGRGRQRGIDKRVGWVVASIAVIAGLVFVFFGGWQQGTSVEHRTLSYSVESDTLVQVRYEVTAPAQSDVVCIVEALSPSYATVGWKLVELEPSNDRTRRFRETMVTTSPATTGTVRSCWVAEPSV